MYVMLNLRSMSDEEFAVVVTPSLPEVASHITIDASGKVLLSSKIAERFAKKPVQLQFNRDFSAIQLVENTQQSDPYSLVFPKNGRKMIPNATELLRQNKIPLPAVYRGYCFDAGKWRGERQQNPTTKSSASTRSIKKK